MVDFVLKLYKMQTSQQFSNTDIERRLRSCQQINGLTEGGRFDANIIICSDKSHIYLNVTLFANSPSVYIQDVFIGKCSFQFGWGLI